MAVESPDLRPLFERHLRTVPRSRSWTISTPGARVVIETTPCDAVVFITGEIDLSNLDVLHDALRNVRALGVTRIVVDASELDFLAVTAARDLAAAEDIAIVGAYGIAERVLDLIAMNRLPSAVDGSRGG